MFVLLFWTGWVQKWKHLRVGCWHRKMKPFCSAINAKRRTCLRCWDCSSEFGWRIGKSHRKACRIDRIRNYCWSIRLQSFQETRQYESSIIGLSMSHDRDNPRFPKGFLALLLLMIRECHVNPRPKSIYQMFYDSICVGFVDAQVVWKLCIGGCTEGIVVVGILLKDIPHFLLLLILIGKDKRLRWCIGHCSKNLTWNSFWK